jgi:hypothetical protein
MTKKAKINTAIVFKEDNINYLCHLKKKAIDKHIKGNNFIAEKLSQVYEIAFSEIQKAP